MTEKTPLHPALRALGKHLRPVVGEWIHTLLQACPGQTPSQILPLLDNLAFGNGGAVMSLSEEDREELRTWLENSYEEDLLDLIRSLLKKGEPRKEHPRATPEQIAIILDAQKEVGLDFGRFTDQLTSWEADVVIKGMVTVSEVQRQTGNRHFPLRDLRAAIRNFFFTR